MLETNLPRAAQISRTKVIDRFSKKKREMSRGQWPFKSAPWSKRGGRGKERGTAFLHPMNVKSSLKRVGEKKVKRSRELKTR